MSRFIAIDGDLTHLYVAAGTSSRGSVKLSKAVAFADMPPVNSGNAVQMGKLFRDKLRAADIAPAPVVVCSGREKIILKDIRYPKPEHEGDEPAVVRFQVIRELSESPDNVNIDYQRLTGEDIGDERKAIAVILKKEIVKSWLLFCEAAGLKLLALVPRPFASLAAVQKAIAGGAVVGPDSPLTSFAILVRTDRWGELTIVRHNQVVFSRSMSSGSLSNESMLVGEIKRNLTVYAGQPGATEVSRLYFAEAADVPNWSGRLKAGLNIPVQSFDPLADTAHDTLPDARGYFTGLVGSGWLEGNGLPVNLVSPRQPVPPRDPAKRLLVSIAPILALVVLMALYAGWSVKSDRDRTASALREQKQYLDKESERVEEDAKRILALNEWRGKGINVLDELFDLTSRFPDIGGTRVTGITFSPRDAEASAKVKYVAALEVRVETENGNAIDGLTREMVRDGHYRVAPKESRGSGAGGINTTRFNQQFTIKADIARREPGEYTRLLEGVSAPPRRPRGGSPDGGGFMDLIGAGMTGGAR